MNGESINPWRHKELPVLVSDEKYLFGFDRTGGIWSMKYLRSTELTKAKL